MLLHCLLAQQAERDRELTFQPRLATEKYWASTARRRGRSASRTTKDRANGVGAPDSAREDGTGGGGRQDPGAVAPPEAERRRVQARFEMLYQDVSL